MSLKAAKRSRRKQHKFPRFDTQSQGGNWNFRPHDFRWNPSSRISKILILSLIITGIALVPLYGYYQFDLLPNSQSSQNSKYDPFTTLWNGTNPAFSQGPAVFDSMQNGTSSAGGSIAKTFVVAVNDFLIVAIFEPSPVTVFTVSDTQGNTFTQRAASPSTVGQTQFQTAKAASAGSDTVTVSSTAAPTWDASILQYSGILTFGVSASSEYATGTVQSGTDTLSLTTSVSSLILEIFDASSASAARCSDITTAPNNGQTNREIYCPSGVRSRVTDVTGFSGTNSIGFTFAYNASQITCSVSTNCFRHHSALELVSSPSSSCPSGYQCLNSKASPNGDIRLFSTSPSPQTLDSFHPSVTTFNNLANDRTVSAGQTFTVGSATGPFEVGSSTFLINKTGTFTGSLQSQIYAISGTAGTNAIPTGNAIASSSTISASSITSGLASALTFSFGAGPILQPGTYFVTVNASSVSSGQTTFPIVWLNGTDSNHNGAFTSPAGSLTWTSTANSYWFTVTSSFSPSEMLTTTPINTATSASKELLFFEDWKNTTNLASGKGWGWYLTMNGTLPNILNYNPLNDTSVAVAVINYGSTTGQGNAYAYVQKQPGTTLRGASNLGENPFPSCPQTSTIFICASPNVLYSPNFVDLSLVLNFTGTAVNGNANGFSLLCSQAQPLNLNFCATTGGINNPCSPPGANICATTTLPWLNIQAGNYYLGFWSAANQTGNIDFGATQNSGATFAEKANSIYYWVPNPTAATPATTSGESFFGWLGGALGTVWNAAAGALAPITSPILGFGGSILSVFISGLIQAGNLLIQGLTVLEQVMITEMNVIGNFIGLGNIGTDLQNFITSLGAYFSGPNLGAIFTNLPSLFSRLNDSLAVYFPWLPNALTTASNVASFGVKGIPLAVTGIGFAFQFVSGAFATYLIAFWFIYTGDDSLAGVLSFVETTEFLVFGLGLKYLAHLVNFTLDVVSYLIGSIPKPLVQMVAHALPRIPIVEVDARFVWPGGSMSEIRNGNMLAAACWVSGVLFLDMYETANPALPGSIGFLLPSAVSALAPMAGFIPFLEILTAFVWGTSFLVIPINWLSNAFDFGEVPFGAALGERKTGGLGAIRFHKASKRFQGRLERKIAERSGITKIEVKPISEGVG